VTTVNPGRRRGIRCRKTRIADGEDSLATRTLPQRRAIGAAGPMARKRAASTLGRARTTNTPSSRRELQHDAHQRRTTKSVSQRSMAPTTTVGSIREQPRENYQGDARRRTAYTSGGGKRLGDDDQAEQVIAQPGDRPTRRRGEHHAQQQTQPQPRPQAQAPRAARARASRRIEARESRPRARSLSGTAPPGSGGSCTASQFSRHRAEQQLLDPVGRRRAGPGSPAP